MLTQLEASSATYRTATGSRLGSRALHPANPVWPRGSSINDQQVHTATLLQMPKHVSKPGPQGAGCPNYRRPLRAPGQPSSTHHLTHKKGSYECARSNHLLSFQYSREPKLVMQKKLSGLPIYAIIGPSILTVLVKAILKITSRYRFWLRLQLTINVGI